MQLYVVCAWCGTLLRVVECETEIDNNHNISHSICEACKAKVKKEADELSAKKPEAA